ncbi:MAG: low molecular weight protein arginine phosphatase [Planctomycetota bacterium]
MMLRVVMVCSGNTCRSPMAEVFFRQMVDEAGGVSAPGLEGVEVASAGVFAGAGQPASEEAKAVAAEYGAELNGHRSTPLTREAVTEADLIYTMTDAHRNAVLAMAPEAKGKTQRLDPRADIDDPFGGTTDAYRDTAEQIRTALSSRIKELNR